LFKKAGITLLFTFGAILTGIIAVAFIIAFPALIDKLGLPTVLQEGLALLRWLFLATVVFFVIAMLYKVAPNRKTPKFMWVKTGAIFATVFWLGGSLLFTLYIDNFSNYDKTYGSIAAVIILMLWFFLTGFIVLLGAEINSEVEHQTTADTTTGSIKPMGRRGAYYADHVAQGDKNNGKHKNH
jgi:membrane protein